MSRAESLTPHLEPVRKFVTVACPAVDAFRVFTDDIARWWPLDRYSVSQRRAASCGIEGRPGGELFEVRDDGQRFPWGRVLVWEPPHWLVFTWFPGREPDTAQQVEVRFVEVDGATRVELEHRDWDRLGARAQEIREGYEQGWDFVLGQCFAGACSA